MKQFDLFGNEKPDTEKLYTAKIQIPIYEPKNKKPHILELFDDSKTKRLITEIQCANITDEEKHFLTEAAKRHTVFNYQRIADYYAHSNKEVQHLMERSALIIIDFEKAIEFGFVRLSNEIANNYLEEYPDEK